MLASKTTGLKTLKNIPVKKWAQTEISKNYDMRYLYGYGFIILNRIIDCMTSSAQKVLVSLINFLAETPCREKVLFWLLSSADWFSTSRNTCLRSMLRPMRCSPTSEIRCWQRSRRPTRCGSVWPWPGRFLGLDLLSHVCGHLSSTRSNSSRAPTRRPPLFSFYEPSLLSGLRATSFATTTCGCLEYFTS